MLNSSLNHINLISDEQSKGEYHIIVKSFIISKNDNPYLLPSILNSISAYSGSNSYFKIINIFLVTQNKLNFLIYLRTSNSYLLIENIFILRDNYLNKLLLMIGDRVSVLTKGIFILNSVQINLVLIELQLTNSLASIHQILIQENNLFSGNFINIFMNNSRLSIINNNIFRLNVFTSSAITLTGMNFTY